VTGPDDEEEVEEGKEAVEGEVGGEPVVLFLMFCSLGPAHK